MDKSHWPTRLQNLHTEPFLSDLPKDVGIAITGRCQLRCHHCFNNSGVDNPHELPLEMIERILGEIVGFGLRHVRITGGEPSFHRQFREVVDACHSRGISMAVNTHGVYSAKMLSYLKTAPIELFLISIDGLEVNNDAIRGHGTFRQAFRSCRELHQTGQNVMIALHVGTTNKGDVQDVIALAADMGVSVKISLIRPVGRAVNELPSQVIQPDDYLKVVQKIIAARKLYPHIRIITDFDILDDPPSGNCQNKPKAASCKAGRTMVNVNYDGAIYPCLFFATSDREFSAGDIYQTTLIEAWRYSSVFQPFRVHRKSETCQICVHYQRSCTGGCPVISHFTTGYLDSHDPTCFAELI